MQNTNSSTSTRNKLFQEIDNLHPILLETIQALHLREMTEIQMRTWDAAIRGTDVIGRSRTGSGKTLAFLLPSIQRIIQTTPTRIGSVECITRIGQRHDQLRASNLCDLGIDLFGADAKIRRLW